MVDAGAVLLSFWHDPGHGWLEVPLETLCHVMEPGEVSGYSYRGKTARGQGVETAFYLEEDCDVALFLAAARRKRLSVYVEHREDDGERVRKLTLWWRPTRNHSQQMAAVEIAHSELAGAGGVP